MVTVVGEEDDDDDNDNDDGDDDEDKEREREVMNALLRACECSRAVSDSS